VPSAQRQAALKAAWADEQRDAGRTLWETPRVFTFNQFCEQQVGAHWAAANLPDRLLPAGAEWAALRQLRLAAGGGAEVRALLTAIRTLRDFGIPATGSALGSSPEAELLSEALDTLAALSRDQGRKPLSAWLADIPPSRGMLLAAGCGSLPAAQTDTLRRLGATGLATTPHPEAVQVATAENDDHELELIAAWCRDRLERNPESRLLVVDARLRQRRRLYDRMLSQTLTPSHWLDTAPRAASQVFAIEGGQSLADFPVIAHAVLTLRLLTGRLRFDEVVNWLRLPFLDRDDRLTGATLEANLRSGRKLEFSAEELAAVLERGAAGALGSAFAARLRQAHALLTGERRSPAEWAPRILAALRLLGWSGARALRSDEQQTVARWQVLLDEYSALGAWLPQAAASDAVATLADLAAERNFDAASVDAPVTLTESHDDPVVRYDGIWVAGLDAAQWPPPPRPDVFIPLHLQVAAGVPWASASAQSRAARSSLAAWRAATDSLACSWARLEGDAHRTPSPLLTRLDTQQVYTPPHKLISLATTLHQGTLEFLDDVAGVALDLSKPVTGGVKPLSLQAECGFHAYGELRLKACELDSPAPGVNARERGMLLHKALELVWLKLEQHFTLVATDMQVLRPSIADAVAAAEVSVFRGYVPLDLRPAMEREKLRLERLIEKLLELELTRAPFRVEQLEAHRAVSIAGGQFEFRVDRIDFIEGGGFAILDYKSGEPRALRWAGEAIRDPQLLAYLMADRGRNVQALANVSLANGRARFSGKSSRKGLLPGVNGLPGMNPSKVPADQIEAAWQTELREWLAGLQRIAAAYLQGSAPVQPASDVCRYCPLTILCRRVELAAAVAEQPEDAHE